MIINNVSHLTSRVSLGVDVDVVLPRRADDGLGESGGGVHSPSRIAALDKVGEVDGGREFDNDKSGCCARVSSVDVGREDSLKPSL